MSVDLLAIRSFRQCSFSEKLNNRIMMYLFNCVFFFKNLYLCMYLKQNRQISLTPWNNCYSEHFLDYIPDQLCSIKNMTDKYLRQTGYLYAQVYLYT